MTTRQTQNERLLRDLRDAGEEGVSAMWALHRLGIYRASARIMELRRAGHVIRTERENGRCAVYFLESK